MNVPIFVEYVVHFFLIDGLADPHYKTYFWYPWMIKLYSLSSGDSNG